MLELAAHALKYWHLEGDLRLIKQRENSVFQLTQKTGRRFVLRIHRGGYHSDRAPMSELLWIKALKENGIAVPEVIPDQEGRLFVRVSAPGFPGDRQVDILSWVDGDPIVSGDKELGDDPERIGQVYKSIGQMAAQLHNHATQWELPQGFERHAWDIDGLVGENPFWGKFWELPDLSKEQQMLILKARGAVRQGLLSFGQSSDNYSLIHADFVPENFLVNGSSARVIDFDDAGFGWHLFDLSTALYIIQDSPGYDIARDSLIDGYREFRVLSDESIRQLPLFFAARGFTYLGWVHARQNKNLTRKPAARLIDMCCRACRRILD